MARPHVGIAGWVKQFRIWVINVTLVSQKNGMIPSSSFNILKYQGVGGQRKMNGMVVAFLSLEKEWKLSIQMEETGDAVYYGFNCFGDLFG